ncbi:MAG: hypothetical protein WAW17_02775 [Rhodococcus sp. (in: high G+C Gram-positive bacteria)]|uniref:hypothetical protein n=1 Tax=Rhodococcus sp. TaxID=1831 RepID=UPI003BB06688
MWPGFEVGGAPGKHLGGVAVVTWSVLAPLFERVLADTSGAGGSRRHRPGSGA